MADLAQAREWLDAAGRVAVLTGAGVSAESGVPTFRGHSGDALWDRYSWEELASPEGFYRDPELVWRWYDWRRGLVAQANPNPAHHALAGYQERRAPSVVIVTQNVDGLHERSGSLDVVRLHGSLWSVRCTRCHREFADERVPLPELPPRCAACQGMLRPGVVWFGEELPEREWIAAQEAAATAQAMLVVGTSAAVYPAAMLVPLAQSNRAKVIEINIEETPLSPRADLHLQGKAGEVLPELLK